MKKQCSSSFKRYLLSSAVERQYLTASMLWVCLQRTVFPLGIARVRSILELRKTVLSEKREVFKVRVLISWGGMESRGKNTAAQRTFIFRNVRSPWALSGEKPMISMGLRSNKCMRTEDLGKADPAQHGLGLDVVQSSAQPPNTPRDSTSISDLPSNCTGSLFSLLSSYIHQNAPSNNLPVLIHWRIIFKRIVEQTYQLHSFVAIFSAKLSDTFHKQLLKLLRDQITLFKPTKDLLERLKN